ncbi:MAG: hypothetical protein GY720_21010, partial [bacterium]|nr:hypothetical protein [bacterium]
GAIIDGAGRALPLAVAGGTAAWAAANVLANLLGDSFLASVATLGLSYVVFVVVAGGVAVGLYELSTRRRKPSDTQAEPESVNTKE